MNRHSGGLGRGLAALIPAGEQEGISLQELSLSAISPNPRQPRGVFDELELEELAASIRDVGLLQPVVVRPLGNERYELIAGERRLRAAKLAGLTRLPAVVRDTPDTGLLKEALIENIHRVQLNPLEEAAAYQQLLDDFQVSQEELATALGKSRPVISNALRLLSLPPPVQRKVAAGVLTAGHAKALLALEDRAAQERLADRIVAEGLSVRSTEEVVRHQLVGDTGDAAGGAGERGGSSSRSGSGGSGPARSPGLAELEENLSDALMTRVKVSMGARKGRISIELASVDDLERIVGVIARGVQEDIPVSASE